MGILDAVGNALSTVSNVVSDSISLAADVATLDFKGAVDDIGGLVGHITDSFESLSEGLGPLGGVFKDALSNLAAGSGLGSLLNSALDSLGLPDWIGDIAGGVLDFCTGNYIGAIANGLDALEDVAQACGGEELAGFLKAGSQVTGMFSGPISTAGADKLNGLVGSAGDTLSALEGSVSGVDALLSGDISGAGSAIIDCFAEDVAGISNLIAPLSDNAERILGEVLEPSETLLSALADSARSAEINLEELAASPLKDLGSLLNFEPADLLAPTRLSPEQIGNAADFLSSLMPSFADFIERAGEAFEALRDGEFFQDLPFIEDLLESITEKLGEAFEFTSEDLQKLSARAKNIGMLFDIAVSDPDELAILKDLLSHAPAAREELETVLYQSSTLRA